MKTTFAIAALLTTTLAAPASAQVDSIIINAMIQALKQKVTVSNINSPVPGYVVVHRSDAGAPGAVIGYAPIKAGQNDQVSVTLNKDAASGDDVIVMLHEDTGQAGKFEFGNGSNEDGPLLANGAPVMRTVTVE